MLDAFGQCVVSLHLSSRCIAAMTGPRLEQMEATSRARMAEPDACPCNPTPGPHPEGRIAVAELVRISVVVPESPDLRSGWRRRLAIFDVMTRFISNISLLHFVERRSAAPLRRPSPRLHKPSVRFCQLLDR